MTWLKPFFLAYYISHIPISLLLDSQALLPARFFPEQVVALASWYAQNFQDRLMDSRYPTPVWFKSLIFGELALQVPLFLFLAYALMFDLRRYRIPAIVYSVHVMTTMLPVLATVLFGQAADFQTSPPDDSARLVLLAIYGPYFLIPLGIFLHALWLGSGIASNSLKSKKRV